MVGNGTVTREAIRSATAVEEILEMGGTGSWPASASARHAVVTWSLLVTGHRSYRGPSGAVNELSGSFAALACVPVPVLITGISLWMINLGAEL